MTSVGDVRQGGKGTGVVVPPSPSVGGPAALVVSAGPGIALAAVLALVATEVARYLPVVGAPVLAIVGGLAVSVAAGPRLRTRWRPGVAMTSRTGIQASVVVLGFGLSLGQVVSTGTRSLPVLVGSLVTVLAAAWWLGRLLGLPRDLWTLVGVGTAVCGASAIAATDAVIEADEADVSYAVGTIFTFNVVAVILYPVLGHAFGFSQHTFGLWAGTAINDLSSVVASTTTYGHAATSYGVVVKLTRTLAIIPICLVLASRRGAAVPADHGDGRQPHWMWAQVRRAVPTFLVVFVLAVAANTAGLVPGGWHHPLSDASTWLITAGLGAVGLSADIGQLRRSGIRPLLLGAILWALVGVVSLGLQAATGTL